MNPPLASRGIDLNDVKTARCLIHPFFAQIPHRRLYNLALLAVVYRFCGKSATDASSCLYLDKDQGITILCDQIDLPYLCAILLCQNSISLRTEIASSTGLPAISQHLIAHGDFLLPM